MDGKVGTYPTGMQIPCRNGDELAIGFVLLAMGVPPPTMDATGPGVYSTGVITFCRH